jgi:hypothetical protein
MGLTLIVFKAEMKKEELNRAFHKMQRLEAKKKKQALEKVGRLVYIDCGSLRNGPYNDHVQTLRKVV